MLENNNKNTILIAKVYCFDRHNRSYFYRIKSNENNQLGSIVEVSFRNKILNGVIIDIQEYTQKDGIIAVENDVFEVKKLKDIKSIVYPQFLTQNYLSFLQKIAFYNCTDIETFLPLAIPTYWLNKKRELTALQKKGKDKKQKPVELTAEQCVVANKIYSKHKNGFNVAVLRGVMGSGKTYIFLDVVRKILQENPTSQALIMVPEIALTSQLIKVIYDFTGIEPIIWHSSVSKAKKKRYYEDIFYGDARIIISTRSGLLLPYKNLQIIVIDEEHDQSYKQDEIPCYNARDMAILRAKYENIQVVLSSATPSIETLNNIIEKKYDLYKINSQFFHITPPDVELVDSVGIKTYLCESSKNAILTTKNKHEQTMIFINRRGFSRTLRCSNCGYEYKCENCDNLLSYHKKKNELICHYCGFKKYKIDKCECCGCAELNPHKGAGVEQIDTEIKEFFDKNKINIKTILFSSDEIHKDDDLDELKSSINTGEVDVIVGTQIMTKGHHFPNLTTIIAIDIDGMCLDGDFRAYEKMFQMLFQLSGRAGREREGAKIYIQTANPSNPVLQHIKNHDIESFYKQELRQRKQYNLPPFSRFIAIIISSEYQEKAIKNADRIGQLLREKLQNIKDVSVLGATESQIGYLKRNYRYRILIKSPKNSSVLAVLNKIKNEFYTNEDVRVKIDVDPYNFI